MIKKLSLAFALSCAVSAHAQASREDMQRWADQTIQGIERQHAQQQGQQEQDPEGLVYFALSFSMPKALLRETLLSLQPGEVALFRGVPKGGNMKDFGDRINELLGNSLEQSTRTDIAIQIDPFRFKKCGVQLAPASCIFNGQKAITAHGVISADYVKRLSESPSRAMGQTWDVAEDDLSELIKQRLAKVSVQKLRQDSLKNLFLNREYVSLPQATANAAFVFDPRQVLSEPYVVGGRVLAQAGVTFNPVASSGNSASFVILDATRSGQIEASKAVINQLKTSGKRVKVILTDLPNKQNGMDTVARLQKALGAPVKLMDQLLAERLRLRAVPSVVEFTGDGRVRVNEIGVKS